MKRIVLAIIVLILVLFISYTAISYEQNSHTLKTFIIKGSKENIETGYNNLNTFVIKQKPSGRYMLIETKKQTQDARKRNLIYEKRDEEIEKCIDKITKNWKRTYYKRSYEKEYDDEKEEWIETNVFYEREKEFWGYDEDEDFRLRWRLRNRALDGKKIC